MASWSQSDNETSKCSKQVQDWTLIDRLESLKSNARYAEALNEVRDDLIRDPSSCFLQVEEADLVRLRALSAKTTTTKREEEEAIAQLITVVDETGTLPAGVVGRSSAFVGVGQYFFTKEDYISALTAYLIARDFLESGHDVPEVVKQGVARFIDNEIRDLAARTGYKYAGPA